MCKKADDTHHSGIEFVPDCSKTQEMCDKATDTSPFLSYSVPDWYNAKKCVVKHFLKIIKDLLPTLTFFSN